MKCHHWDDLGKRSYEMINKAKFRLEGFFYRAIYNYYTNNFAMAAKCLDRAMQLYKMPQSNLWLNTSIYNYDRMIAMYKEVETKMEFSNLQPMRPETIEDAYGPMAGLQMEFGRPGVQTSQSYFY